MCMTKFINTEYLIALAFSKLDKKVISIREKIDSVFVFSHNYIRDTIKKFSNDFEFIDDNTIRQKITDGALLAKFIVYLSNNILKAVFLKRR